MKAVLAVVDVEGSPVEGAKAVFSVFTSFDECYKLVRDTDSDGRCGIAGKTRGEITVVVMKSGYYPSHGSLKYRDLSWDEAVSEHRWTREGLRFQGYMLRRNQCRQRAGLWVYKHMMKGR